MSNRKNDKEKLYYRGTNPKIKKRITTGEEEWDDNLFCSLIKKEALNYGSVIEVIKPKENAKILQENTSAFKKIFGRQKSNESLLDWCVRGKIIAKDLGYDIIEFHYQGLIGTVIMNENSVIRNYKGEL